MVVSESVRLCAAAGARAPFVAISAAFVFSACGRPPPPVRQIELERVTVDSEGPRAPWAKALADLDGDGLPDLIVGGRDSATLVAYRSPTWERQTLATSLRPTTALASGDLDGDGDIDVVVGTDDRVLWLRNPDWTVMEVGAGGPHDLRVADVNGDGRADVIGRGQSRFRDDGDMVVVFLNDGLLWRRQEIEVVPGEGLAVKDIDGDSRVDLAVNGWWLKNEGLDPEAGIDWQEHEFAKDWDWPDAVIATGDFDRDGKIDLALAPSEPGQSSYRISWFAQPVEPTAVWREIVIDASVETVQHGLAAADFDNDGWLDIAVAAMHQGSEPGVRLYVSSARGETWTPVTIDETGSHNIAAADIFGDGAIDLFGANWSGPDQSIKVWRNLACGDDFVTRVRRHVVGTAEPGTAVFVQHADIDGDGMDDLAAGAYWFRNPGLLSDGWERHAFGSQANNVLLLHDFNRDARPDLFASTWPDGSAPSGLVLLENTGGGQFVRRISLNGTAGDFPQGVALVDLEPHSAFARVAISWHDGGDGVELIEIPTDLSQTEARRHVISTTSQDEDLSSGDIDGDGDSDLLLGTIWLEQTPEGWLEHGFSEVPLPPDRNELADLDGDGKLNGIVGAEAISEPGPVTVYTQGEDVERNWVADQVATVIGPMSIGLGDFNGDDRLDIVVGEHNLADPGAARLWLFEAIGDDKWRGHILSVGDEHHDGALVVDIDSDGDPDIASIGWSHRSVLVYESLTAPCFGRRSR
jgi:hypothetical protein